MKAPKPLYALLVAALLGLPAIVHSQTATTAVPGFISYQGRVVDGSGNPVGAGTPVNRTVIFRVWDHPSNTLVANLIYSEQQTVTVSEGEFSVLVGQGVAVLSTVQFGYNESGKKLVDLGAAFTGATRYLGVTVDDGTATADNEITPRQQIVSTGFAFRSKIAESLGTSTGGTSLNVLDNGNVGVGNSNPPARFTVSGTSTGTGTPQLIVTDPADTNERLRIGMDNTGNGRGYIQAFKEGTGAQNLLLNPAGGNVGIGTLNPNRPLTVGGINGIVVGDEITDNATSLSLALSAATNGYARLQSIKTQNVSYGDIVLNEFGGNVGIGRNTTDAKLDVWGQMKVDNGGATAPPQNGVMGGGGTRLVLWPGAANQTPYGFGIDGGTLWSGVPVNSHHKWYVGTSNPMTLHSSGSLGIGTNNPAAPLHVFNNSFVPAIIESNSGIGTWLDIRNSSVGGTNWHLVSTGTLNSEGAGKLLFIQGATPGGASAVPFTVQSNGRVGIGTSFPGFPLNFPATLGDKISLYGESGNHFGFGIQGSLLQIHTDVAGSDIAFGYGSSNSMTETMRIAGHGQLISTKSLSGSAGEGAFLVRKRVGATISNVLESRTFVNGGPLNLELWEGNAFKPGGGSWGAVSDRRLKKDIAPLKGAMEKLEKLNPVTYQFIDPKKSGQLPGTQVGFIAQEVEKVFPEWITENGEGYKTINIRGFESLAVQALRELRTEKDGEIKALQSEVAESEKKIAALEKRLAELESGDKARDAKLASIEKFLAAAAKPAAGRTVALKKGSTAE